MADDVNAALTALAAADGYDGATGAFQAMWAGTTQDVIANLDSGINLGFNPGLRKKAFDNT